MRLYLVVETPKPFSGEIGSYDTTKKKFYLLLHIPSIKDLSTWWTNFKRSLVTKRDHLYWKILGDRRLVWKAWFKLTKSCGVWGEGHWPLFNNPNSWMWKEISRERVSWKKEILTSECAICGFRTKTNISFENYEFSPEFIKEGRKKYAKQLLQPYRQGEFSKEYRDAYPDISKRMVKEGVITQKQHDSAKDVWDKDIY